MVPRAIRPYGWVALFLERNVFMEKIMSSFLWFGVFFIFVFVAYFFLLRFKIKKNKVNHIWEISYLIQKFNLDMKKINAWKLIIPISLMNSFIISFVATFVMMIPLNVIFQFLIGFVLLLALIYSFYEIYGRHLAKKYKKD